MSFVRKSIKGYKQKPNMLLQAIFIVFLSMLLMGGCFFCFVSNCISSNKHQKFDQNHKSCPLGDYNLFLIGMVFNDRFICVLFPEFLNMNQILTYLECALISLPSSR